MQKEKEESRETYLDVSCPCIVEKVSVRGYSKNKVTKTRCERVRERARE